jgi:hypothetical protein
MDMALVSLAFGDALCWVDHLVTATATGEALPFHAIASVMLTSAAFFLSMAAIHVRVGYPAPGGGGGHLRLQRFLVTAATAAAMAAVVARCLAYARTDDV